MYHFPSPDEINLHIAQSPRDESKSCPLSSIIRGSEHLEMSNEESGADFFPEVFSRKALPRKSVKSNP